jgi:hypothetical protein
MAMYTNTDELPTRLANLFVPNEELVVATHFTYRFVPKFLSKYSPYYVVTDRRFIEFQLVANKRTDVNEIQLTEISRVESEYNHLKNQTTLTVAGAGFKENFTGLNNLIDPISDTLRNQLAKQDQTV